MEFHFNDNVANKYGSNCAVILNNIIYWVDHNKANDENFRDGHYWTFNTAKAFAVQFSFMNERQIRYALDKLIKEGLILTANYNDTCKRTLWYTYTQKALDLINGVKETISQEIQNASESILEDQKTAKKAENCSNISSSANSNVALEEKTNPEEKPNVTKLSNSNDKIVNTMLQNCQIEVTKLSDSENNKPQIINSNNKLAREKETYKEKEPESKPSLESVCVQILDFWNHQGLVFCEELTPRVSFAIKTALKTYSPQQIEQAISHYAEILFNNAYFFSHQWGLKSFLNTALADFLDTGEKWLGYQAWLHNSKTPRQSTDTQGGFIHNNYTQDQISNFISNLDEVAI